MNKTLIDQAVNADLETQRALLIHILQESPLISQLIPTIPQLNLPEWYVATGCIFQTVWNSYYNLPPTHGIKDCDLIYFDATDTSYEAEDAYIQKGAQLFAQSLIEVEIRNEARVHLWYKEHFKEKDIEPYQSTEEAIRSFPATAACIGVTLDATGTWKIYAPYGLTDLFSMIVRPNKNQITETIYHNKVNRWHDLWPELTIIPWNS